VTTPIEGFVDWTTYETIQTRLQSNIHAAIHQAGRALREGSHSCKAWLSVAIVVVAYISLAGTPRAALRQRGIVLGFQLFDSEGCRLERLFF
jgi:hypothetical protein